MRAPDFWTRRQGVHSLLAPLGTAYGVGVALRRRTARPWRATVPVICAGNLVGGGAGKTPLALALGAHLKGLGRTPHFLSRGYGGTEAGPLRVDPALQTADQVGDEPLLLARTATTWVAGDRAAGARAAMEAGADALVLDDGFQNNQLVQDLSLLAVDGGYGFGNGRVMPAGPLRESLGQGIRRAHGVVLIGTDSAGLGRWLKQATRVDRARLTPVPGPATDEIAGSDVVAFAGIARPEKFYLTLRGLGCRLVATRNFPDHHPYGEEEIMALVEQAVAENALPVTTAKDAARLTPDARAMVKVLCVALEWYQPEALDQLLAPVFGHG